LGLAGSKPLRRRTRNDEAHIDKGITALLVIDPYNDFISEGGKLWDHIRAVAEANDCVPHMLQVLDAAREAKLRVFYALHLSRIPASKRPFALRLSLVTI
jgi:nicotinamidase-related amidase